MAVVALARVGRCCGGKVEERERGMAKSSEKRVLGSGEGKKEESSGHDGRQQAMGGVGKGGRG